MPKRKRTSKKRSKTSKKPKGLFKKKRRGRGRRALPSSAKLTLKKLSNFMKQQTAVHIRRVRATGTMSCAANEASYTNHDHGGSKTRIEAAVAALRFYDVNTDAMVTRDAAVGTYNRDINIGIRRSCFVKNNYDMPVKVQIYSCTPKDATSVTPLSAFTSSMVTQLGAPATSPLVNFNDAVDLKKMWTVKKVCSKTLAAGQGCFASANLKSFSYDFSLADMHSLLYLKKQGGHSFVIRVTGVLGHDAVAIAEQGFTKGGVDFVLNVQYRIQYDAGKDLHDILLVDQSSNFTNEGVVATKPLAGKAYYALN